MKKVGNAVKENLLFLREFLVEFENTGTMFPTSSKAAEALTAPIRERDQAVNILELGPGTGSVTVRILKDMQPGDRLTVCEINPRFMKALQEMLESNPDFQRHRSRVTFHTCAAQELPENQRYDLIVCAIPFLNFELPVVEDIFRKLKALSHSETVMTYYEYIGLRSLNKAFSSAFGKRRIHQIDGFFKGVFRLHNMRRKRVWLNMLPINVYRIDIGCNQSMSSQPQQAAV